MKHVDVVNNKMVRPIAMPRMLSMETHDGCMLYADLHNVIALRMPWYGPLHMSKTRRT